MCWRKWVVRILVFSVTGGLAGAGFLYLRWTDPAAVRAQVIDKLGAHLVGADVSLDSAQMQLLGGIYLRELRLTRKDDPSKREFAYVPSAVIYPDKEKLFDGKIVIRKIELTNPRLHLRRGRDGRWNLSDILGPVRLDEPIPTIVIRQGTLYFEDQFASPSFPPLAVAHVNLVLLNDPLPTINIEGSGQSELAGNVRIKGTFQRKTEETALAIEAADIPLGPPLLDHIRVYQPELADQARELTGTASVQAELAYSPQATPRWTQQLRLTLKDGKLKHPRLPVPLDHIEASVRCQEGRAVVDKLTARSGSARLELTATAQACRSDADCSGILKVEHLDVTPDLFASLPEYLQRLNGDFAPTGPVSLTLEFQRKDGRWLRRHCMVRPEDMTATFVKFPYPLVHLQGVLDQEIDLTRNVDSVKIDLAGRAGDRTVHVQGSITGEAPLSEVNVKVWGENIPLDGRLEAALPAEQRRLAQQFHPTGLANFEAYIHRDQGGREFINRFVIRFHHATARYDVFPYPLEDVSGVLDIKPDHWEFYDFHGTHKGGVVRTKGRSVPNPAGVQLAIDIQGEQVAIDGELDEALVVEKELRTAWKMFAPAGRMNFIAHVDRLPDQVPDVDVLVTATGCRIKPEFFPYELTDLSGSFHYAKRWVVMEKLQARHGPTVLTVPAGKIYLKPEGGVWADVPDLQGSPLVPDAELLAALPKVLRNICEAIGLKDPVHLRTRLTVASSPGVIPFPDVYWDGELRLADASLYAGVQLEHLTGKAACRGRYNGLALEGISGNLLLDEIRVFNQPFRKLQGKFLVKGDKPNLLTFEGLRAEIFGGEVYGPAQLEFGSLLKYELNLMASQIELEQFSRHNLKAGTPVSGVATAHVYLAGQGPELADLSGGGTVDVPSGRLGNLPVLLDLLKFLALRPPDGTAFEEMHTAFTVKGRRVLVSRLDLFGNSVSLRGQGELNLDGSDINLDFYAVWARIIQYLPPIIKGLSQEFSSHLLKIKMRGSFQNVRLEKEPVPVLVDPVKDLMERMRKKAATNSH